MSIFAREIENVEKIAIQHHYAHVLSCAAENNYYDEVIGVAFDGTGYGDDGKLWGGEFFIANPSHYERAAHFKYVPLPGGEEAIKNPWRLLVPFFLEIMDEKETLFNEILRQYSILSELVVMVEAVKKGMYSPLTSSAGRLFDCVSALLGIKGIVSYEGEAAVQIY